MKKIKCVKCGLYFKQRDVSWDKDYQWVSTLCWNCASVWRIIGVILESLGNSKHTKREIVLNLDNIIIRKKQKWN